VVIGDPRRHKSEALFRALGRFIDSLGGRFIAAEGVGTNYNDMDNIRLETRYVVGIPLSRGGSGDPAPYCAEGVIRGIEACRCFLTGSEDLSGLKVAVQGVGSVGTNLVGKLLEAGAEVVIADVDGEAVKRVTEEYHVEAVSPSRIYGVECDVFSPCALGGVIDDKSIPRLKCSIVAGGANNQLAESRHGEALHRRGIFYAPDYIVNAGGLINVTEEIYDYDEQRAMRRIAGIKEVLLRILEYARKEGTSTMVAADRLARERMEKVKATAAN
jgi:leucine dehydrogenase